MDSQGLSPFGLRFDGLPGTGMSIINFLIAGVIKLLSHAEITFSQETRKRDFQKSMWFQGYVH